MTGSGKSDVRELPMGVGHLSLAWVVACLVLLSIVALGVYGYLQQRLHGDIVTGLRTIGQGGPPWGLYIVFDVVFVGLAFSGITLTATARLFRLRSLWPIARISEALAVISLAMAGLCVIADLGRPLAGLLNLPKYARTGSPFFGTFTLVIGTGLCACVIYLFLDGRADAAVCAQRGGRASFFYRLCATGYTGTEGERHRHRKASFWMSFVLLPIMLIAFSTLGFVFGVQGGRPGWYGSLQAPGFVVLAATSGLGVILVIAGLVRARMNLRDEIPARVFRLLGNALGVLILVNLYLIAVEQLTALYAAGQSETELAREIATGAYAPLFWTMIVCFVLPLVVLFERGVRRKDSPNVVLAMGLVVNVAAVLKRYLLVVPSQTHGDMLPWPSGHYAPTWVEYSVVAGLIALGSFLYLVYLKVFPIVPLETTGVDPLVVVPKSQRPRGSMRSVLFAFVLLLGVSIAGFGFAWSARLGSSNGLDPLVPFGPVLFIVGVAIALSSALVYELMPARTPSNARGD